MSPEFTEVDYLQSIVQPLVDSQNDVRITKTTDEMGVLLSLQVAKADMGKVIGKEGNNAKSIRTLLNAFGMRNHSKISIKILEPEAL